MKKLLSLALALVLILGVTVVPASASTTDHPAGWEGLTPTNECTCGDNPIITDSSMFYDLGLSIDNKKFDNRMHTIVIQFHDIHQAYTPITIDLRTDEGRALYAEYEAKWQAMKNGQTAKTTTAPVATPAPTPTPTPTPVPTATPTPVATSAPVLASAAGSDFTIENGVLTKYNGSGGNVLIPGSVTSIGNYAFSSCDSLTSVTIPSSVTSIGHHAFWLCHSLTSVTIPGSVTSIGDDAFSGCSGLTKVTIENGVTSIGARAFHGCAILTSVTIPSSVTSIGLAAFSGCHGLKNVYYDGTTAQWKVIKIQNTNSKLTSATIHYNTTTSTSTPTPSAKQVNPDFDKTVFTDLGLEIAWASHEGLDENGIDTYYIFSGIQLVEYVTNAIGDKTYAKYELLRDTVVRKIGSNENSKSELTTSTETPPLLLPNLPL